MHSSLNESFASAVWCVALRRLPLSVLGFAILLISGAGFGRFLNSVNLNMLIGSPSNPAVRGQLAKSSSRGGWSSDDGQQWCEAAAMVASKTEADKLDDHEDSYC